MKIKTTHQNSWDVVKAVLRGTCLALTVYIRKSLKSMTLASTLKKKVEEEGKIISKCKKNIIRIRARNNEM